MRIVADFEQINAAGNGISIDVLLVLMQQNNASRTCPRSHLAQPPEHFIPPRGRVGRTYVAYRGSRRIIGEYANEGRLKEFSQCDCTVETLQVLVEGAIDGYFANGRADSGNSDTLCVQRFLDRGDLRFADVKHI